MNKQTDTEAREMVLVDRDDLAEHLLWANQIGADPVAKATQLRLERQLTAEPPTWWMSQPEQSRWPRRALLVAVCAALVLLGCGIAWLLMEVMVDA